MPPARHLRVTLRILMLHVHVLQVRDAQLLRALICVRCGRLGRGESNDTSGGAGGAATVIVGAPLQPLLGGAL